MPVVFAHAASFHNSSFSPFRDGMALLMLDLSPKNGTHDLSTSDNLMLDSLQNPTTGV